MVLSPLKKVEDRKKKDSNDFILNQFYLKNNSYVPWPILLEQG